MRLCVRTWHQFPRGVGNIDLHQQGMRVRGNRVTVANHRSTELLTRESSDLKRRLHSVGNLFSVSLWHCNVGANHIDLRDAEQFISRASVAGIDEITDVGLALRNDAIER